MKRLRRDRRGTGRSRLGAAGAELTGALSIASQMALLYPPGFDEWAYRELGGGVKRPDRRPARPR